MKNIKILSLLVFLCTITSCSFLTFPSKMRAYSQAKMENKYLGLTKAELVDSFGKEPENIESKDGNEVHTFMIDAERLNLETNEIEVYRTTPVYFTFNDQGRVSKIAYKN
ncbi:hypothetical protein [Nonlabens sp.]|uniref:hypothetical protein n=1 Tax=Nonlabens sp. TaxID=1888209 RepID=UPI003F69B56E